MLEKDAAGITAPQATLASALGLLALYSGQAGYNYGNSRTNESLLNKAVKNKDYLKSLRTPAPIQINAV